MSNLPLEHSRRLLRNLSLVSLIAIAFSVSIAHLSLSKPANSFSATATQQAFPNPAIDLPTTPRAGKQTVILAGGCFWGMEAVFEHLKGVSNVVSGFSGGEAKTAHYEAVSTGQTGHAESVQITYDPAQISYGQLLKVYFSVAHNPTELNRQGPDTGTQYRSAIFFANSDQKRVAEAYIDQLNKSHTFQKPVVTQLTPLTKFYAAEDYHQDFIDHNPNYPYVVVHDLPKIQQLKTQYTDLYKN